MQGSLSGMLAGGLLLAGTACGSDAAPSPLPALPLPEIDEAFATDEHAAGASQHPGYRVVEVEGEGTITGRVRFRGIRPRFSPFDVPRNTDVCGQSQPNPIFVAGPSGGFSDVVVWVDVEEGAEPEAPAEPVTIEQRGCRFEPHVSVAHRGERVVFRNADAALHNVRAEWEDGSPWFTVGQPREGDVAVQAPQRPGVARLLCDAGHPWALGFVHVFDHPYHAVTDAEGSFRIEGVPPGLHRIRWWHANWEFDGYSSGRPVFGEAVTADAEISVQPGSEVEVSLLLPAQAAEG